jgi:hypothetical protein
LNLNPQPAGITGEENVMEKEKPIRFYVSWLTPEGMECHSKYISKLAAINAVVSLFKDGRPNIQLKPYREKI